MAVSAIMLAQTGYIAEAFGSHGMTGFRANLRGANPTPTFHLNPKRAAMNEVAVNILPILNGQDSLARIKLLVDLESFRKSSPSRYRFLAEELNGYGYRLRSSR